MAIDFSKVKMLANGVRVINCTPHKVTFIYPEGVEEAVEPCGATLKANANEKVSDVIGPVTFVKTVFSPSPEGQAELDLIMKEVRENLIIIGSLISAQAWPGLVAAMVSAPGFERVTPIEKRMDPAKFNIF